MRLKMKAVTLSLGTCLISRQPFTRRVVIVMLLQPLLQREVKVTWLYKCLALTWHCHRKSPQQPCSSTMDQDVLRLTKKAVFFFSAVQNQEWIWGTEWGKLWSEWRIVCVLFRGWWIYKVTFLLRATEKRSTKFMTEALQIHATTPGFLQLTHNDAVYMEPHVLWYCITPPTSISPMDWPSHFRPVRHELLPIFDHGFNITLYPLAENRFFSPTHLCALTESPWDLSSARIPVFFSLSLTFAIS